MHEVGFEDAQPLIELATPRQLQGCFDLEAWNKDQLEVPALKPWLTALLEAGFEKVGEHSFPVGRVVDREFTLRREKSATPA